MAKKEDVEYALLNDSEKDDMTDIDWELHRRQHQRWWGKSLLKNLVYAVALLGSLIANATLIWKANTYKMVDVSSAVSQLRSHASPYSGLAHDVSTPYEHDTEFNSKNETVRDAAWDSISIDPLVIAVTKDWAKDKGLTPSWDFPWDGNKQYYFLKVFHQLHCLKVIRKTLNDFERHGAINRSMGHISHCLDTMRQDVMCKGDDTPMAAKEVINGIGYGQEMQCVDFKKLVAWTKAPQQDACYAQVSDYKRVNAEAGIERFAYCRESSPYHSTMKSYFDIHGHKDLFIE